MLGKGTQGVDVGGVLENQSAYLAVGGKCRAEARLGHAGVGDHGRGLSRAVSVVACDFQQEHQQVDVGLICEPPVGRDVGIVGPGFHFEFGACQHVRVQHLHDLESYQNTVNHLC